MGAIQNWLVSVALKKGVRRGVLAVVALLGTAKAQALLSQYGVSVDGETLGNALTVAATGAVVAGLEFARNWLKHKKGVPVP